MGLTLVAIAKLISSPSLSPPHQVRAAFLSSAAKSEARVAELAADVTRAHVLAVAALEAKAREPRGATLGQPAVPVSAADALGEMRAQLAAQVGERGRGSSSGRRRSNSSRV